MIYIGADHGGFELKTTVINYLKSKNIDVKDCGAFNEDAKDNFTDFVPAVVSGVLSGDNKGILICGTGLGVSIMANHNKGIRAAMVHSVEYAKLSREHNDANIVCLGGRFINKDKAIKIVDAFLSTPVNPNPKYKERMNIADGSL